MTIESPTRQKLQGKESPLVTPRLEKAPAFDLYEQFLNPSTLRVAPCLLGIMVGFAFCCLAGALVSKANFYEDFHRFNDYLSPTTLYYPSVSQMIAIVDSKAKPEQTIVIIGGNSIFNGVAQRKSEIWTDQLARQLGPDFAVFNFATCGSQPFEGAYWVAESLLKKKRKVLYITVAIPTMGGAPDGGKIYGYLYWDALSKNLLLKSPERNKLIQNRISMMDEKERSRISELFLRMQLNKLLHFEDLWTAVGYKSFFTVWTAPTGTDPFKARKDYPDFQPDPQPLSKRFSSTSLEGARELATVRGYCDGFFEITGKDWKPRESAWANLLTDVKGIVPDQFKRNCLVVIASNPPYFLEKITSEQRARIALATEKSEQCWRQAGYHAANTENKFSNEDFQDCWHLVGTGGKRMSSLVAEQIIALNTEMGFAARKGSN